MMANRLLVCLKWVSLRPEVDPLTGTVSTDPRFSGASPADWSALEWALRLADDNAEVIVATVAPVEAEPLLREALAAGATQAIRVEAGLSPSSREVAAQLAAIASDVDSHLVVTGDHSLDRGSGSVPAFIAAELDRPQALGLVSATSAETGLVVERRLDQGRRERLAVSGSAVLSFEAGPQLRRASLAATLSATNSPIDTRSPTPWSGTVPEPRIIGSGPYRPRPNVKPGPAGTTRERLLTLSGSEAGEMSARVFDGDADQAAAIAHAQLIEWGYLDRADRESPPSDS